MTPTPAQLEDAYRAGMAAAQARQGWHVNPYGATHSIAPHPAMDAPLGEAWKAGWHFEPRHW
jgi:hypothetical protein